MAQRRHLPGVRPQLRRRRRRRRRRPGRRPQPAALPPRPRRRRPVVHALVPVAAGRRRLRRRRLPGHRPDASARSPRPRRSSPRPAALGLRTIVDVVPNHVSDQHPWFQAALAAGPGCARAGPVLVPARPRARAATSRPTTGCPTSAARRGPAPRTTTARPASGTSTCSRPSSPTSTGPTPTCAASTRTCCGSGSTGAWPASASTRRSCWPRTRRCPRSAPATPSSAPGQRQHPASTRTSTATSSTTSTPRWRRVADGYDEPRLLVGEVWMPDAERLALYLPPDELHTAFNLDFLACPWDAGPPARAASTPPWPRTPTSAPRPPGSSPTTTSPGPSPATAGPTRRSRSRPSGPGRRPTWRSGGGGPGRPRCWPWRCPGPSTSTRARSWACPRSRTSSRTASRTRCTSARAASTPAATAPGCRCRGRATAPPFGFSPDGADGEPWLPQPARLGRAHRRGPGRRPRLDARRCTGRRCGSAGRSDGLGDGPFALARRADRRVLAFARGDGFACVVNLSDAPVDLPAARRRCCWPASARRRRPARPRRRRWLRLPSRRRPARSPDTDDTDDDRPPDNAPTAPDIAATGGNPRTEHDMRSTRTRIGAALVVALALGLVAACGDDDDGGGGDAACRSDEEVTISVSNLPPETEPETREAFLTRVEEFEAANPEHHRRRPGVGVGRHARSARSSPATRCRRPSRSPSPTARP